jgi:hypothetical protein
MKFHWILSQYGVVDIEIADYLAKKGTMIGQTSASKLSFYSAKLRIKRNG